MIINPAIVVVAYNRPHCLNRLLNSLNNAIYLTQDIHLIISIDKSNNEEVEKIANLFQWKFGEKIIIKHTHNLGVRRHIIECGNLTEKYENIIVFEDDMYVSPHFFDFAVKSLSFYINDEKICGISLYGYDFNFYANMRFIPIEDGFCTYFMQYPSSLGQIWNKKWWNNFSNWYLENQEINNKLHIPDWILSWPETSWKKYFTAFMVEYDLYFVYPRISYATNFCKDAGTHNTGIDNNSQVNLSIGETNINFSIRRESQAIYDVYYELKSEIFKKWSNELQIYDFDVDIFGRKEFNKISTEYLLSSRLCDKCILSWNLDLIPSELNVKFNNLGKGLFFGKTKNFNKNPNKVNVQLLLNYQKKLNFRKSLILFIKALHDKFIRK